MTDAIDYRTLANEARRINRLADGAGSIEDIPKDLLSIMREENQERFNQDLEIWLSSPEGQAHMRSKLGIEKSVREAQKQEFMKQIAALRTAQAARHEALAAADKNRESNE